MSMSDIEFIQKYPDIEERKKVWLDSEWNDNLPLVQHAFPDLNATERELLLLKKRGLSPEQIDNIMKFWEEIEREEAEQEMQREE